MNKKLVVLIAIVFLVFFIFLYFYYKENSYTYEYKLDGISIIENYNKDTKLFSFEINDNKNIYELELNGEYSNKRGIITSIENFENNEMSCIKINGDLNFYPICTNEGNYYFSHEEKDIDVKKTYKDINIYNVNDKYYFIWNYNGFIYINDQEETTIDLFKSDTYLPTSNIKLNDELFVPNYDEKYYFDSYYILDFKTGEHKEYKLSTELSFDLVYINYENGILKLYDDETSKAYDIDIESGDVTTNNGVKYNTYTNEFETYSIIDGYINYKKDKIDIVLDVDSVSKIIYQNNDEVIFLVDNKLYSFKIHEGLKLLLESSEWEFNTNNKLYIY